MKKRILLIFTVLILIGVITTGFISLRFSRDEYISELENYMTDYAELIALEIYSDDSIDYEELVDLYAGPIQSRVTIIDRDGVVVGDSGADIGTLDNHGDRPEVIEAYTGKVGSAIRYSDTLKTDLYYVAYPILHNGQSLVIRISKPMYEIQAFSNRLITNYIFAIFAGTILAMVIGLRFEKYLVKPIEELIVLTKRIAAGNFGERIYTNSDDEIQELSNSFNIMSEELKNKMDEIELVNLRLQSTLDSMVNGVIALDNEKKVLFVNPQAERIIKVSQEQSKGRHLFEVFRNNVVYNLLETYFSSPDVPLVQEEIEYGERSYIININPIYSSQDKQDTFGALILMQDITELKRLENLRKDFVANVSHELKTPLTSIRGFVETLRYGNITDEDTRSRFLEILEIESHRLTSLIEDTLMLSEIEQSHILGGNDFKVVQAMQEVLSMMRPIAENANVLLGDQVELEEEISLHGNVSWFKQILINLMDNAVKYNVPGGMVTLRAKKVSETLEIKICDTGIGIPKEHHDRLFERFYRVDSSRSKDQGGTGLGLAIVKHAVISFGGTIELESENGTCFTVTIPL